jgi:hypothetical protein
LREALLALLRKLGLSDRSVKVMMRLHIGGKVKIKIIGEEVSKMNSTIDVW